MEDTLFIVNPISGGVKKSGVLELLRSQGCEVSLTRYAGHAESLARQTPRRRVVAVGGDGTMNEVARGLLGTGKVLGLLPCGSGDGLALCLGISRNPAKALEIVRRGRTARIDCARIDSHPFFSVCGVGVDAMVSERFAAASSRGLATYVREALRLWKEFEPSEYVIEIDGKTHRTQAALITVGNSNQWGNNARITPLASPGDGLLDITVVKMFRSVDIPALVWRLFTGSIHRSGLVESLRGRQIRITGPRETPAHYDGDCFRSGKTVEVEILPEKLEIIVP